MSVTASVTPLPVSGQIAAFTGPPLPRLFVARGLAVGDVTGGAVTIRVSWSELKTGQLARCIESFIPAFDGGTIAVTLHGLQIMTRGVSDTYATTRISVASTAAEAGRQTRFQVPSVVRMDGVVATGLPALDLTFGTNVNGALYTWITVWLVVDLYRTTAETLMSVLAVPQISHP